MDAEELENFVTKETNRFGMLLFIISEGTFFAFLIIAYVYLHGSMKNGPNASSALNPLRTGFYTLFLLGSSFTMARAEKHQRRGQHSKFRNWLFVTMALGVVFMVGQGREYLHLYSNGVTISRNVFGTAFFTVTGFHGLHVLMGLLALTIMLALTQAGDFQQPNSSAVGAIAMYWHFVDWVWVVIFSVVYLWPVL